MMDEKLGLVHWSRAQVVKVDEKAGELKVEFVDAEETYDRYTHPP